MEQQFDRFKGASWFPKGDESILVGGCGGIGSWVTFFLARIGYLPIVYDFDVIEEHNIGGQLFRHSDIGRLKVSAISQICKDFCGIEITGFESKVTQQTPTHHFVISAFDNMQARKDLFEVWKRSIPDCPVTPVFIDGRLEMEHLQIFFVTPDRIADYEARLFDDSLIEDAPCTMKQSSHVAAMIASKIVGMLTNHLSNIYERENMRTTPFYYEFVVPLTLTMEQQ